MCKIEEEVTMCPYCKENVISYWTNRGCLSKPEYLLIADLIYHTECWDKQIEYARDTNKDL